MGAADGDDVKAQVDMTKLSWDINKSGSNLETFTNSDVTTNTVTQTIATATGVVYDTSLEENTTKTENDGFADLGEYYYMEQTVQIEGNTFVDTEVEVDIERDVVDEVTTVVDNEVEITIIVPNEVDIEVEETVTATATRLVQ